MQTRYLLYIDESGGFERKNERWLIAGVLIKDTNQDAVRRLDDAMDSLHRRWQIRDFAKEDIHLTRLRKDFGSDLAASVVRSAVAQLLATFGSNARLLGVLNSAHISTSGRETTYRMMLLDMLCLADALIAEDPEDVSLEVVVATRTINGIKVTTRSDIDADVIDSILKSAEVDLASRGLVYTIVNNTMSVSLKSARWHWGLILADLLANTLYNAENMPDRETVAGLESTGTLRIFKSFGGYEERRALVAERDGHVDLAIYRWIMMSGSDSRRTESLRRLCDKLLAKTPTGRNAVLDSVLAMIMDWCRDRPERYRRALTMLSRLENSLVQAIDKPALLSHSSLLFGLRNIMLGISNHIGDSATGRRLVEEQEFAIKQISRMPECFPLLLDYWLFELEIAINELQLTQARERSERYSKLVSAYRECWALMSEDGNEEAFDRSRVALRARMTDFRTALYVTPYHDAVALKKLADLLDSVRPTLAEQIDKSRWFCYRIHCLLKIGSVETALMEAENRVAEFSDRSPDCFELLHVAKAAASYAMSNLDDSAKRTKPILGCIIKHTKLLRDHSGHPFDLLYREIGLLRYCSDPEGAKRAVNAEAEFRRASSAIRHIEQTAPIAQWLRFLLEAHRCYTEPNGQSITVSGFLSQKPLDEAGSALIPRAILHTPIAEALPILRRVSPY